MMVRSAVNDVSNTRSKPMRRSAATILPSTSCAGFHAELLGQADRNRRRVLHDNQFLRVCQRRDHFFQVRLLGQRAGGAADDALAAVDAGRHVQALVEGRADEGLAAAADKIDGRRRPGSPRRRARSGRTGCTSPDRGRWDRRRPVPAHSVCRGTAAGGCPCSATACCRSHLPLRAQYRQSSGWLLSSSSTIVRRASSTLGERV